MIVVVMGPTGVGKTTTGSLLAKRLGWEFVDVTLSTLPEMSKK